jgi:hypothetical protein
MTKSLFGRPRELLNNTRVYGKDFRNVFLAGMIVGAFVVIVIALVVAAATSTHDIIKPITAP